MKTILKARGRQMEVHYVNAGLPAVIEENFAAEYLELGDLSLEGTLLDQESLYQSIQSSAKASASSDSNSNQDQTAGEKRVPEKEGESSQSKTIDSQLAADEALAIDLNEEEIKNGFVSFSGPAETTPVIANHLSKQLCIKIFPEVSKIDRVIETNAMEPIEAMSTDSMEYESLERDHRVFAFLAQGLASFTRKNCISKAIIASSTDNFPEESIDNTLVASDRVDERASYWSSKGASDPAVPETLTYQLVGNLCVITEISVQPFQAFFQYGFPIYSAKAVRFRLGHPKFPMEIESDSTDEYRAGQISVDDKFIWTYTSPEFPMVQENSLQKFKLPEPVLCIGGILQIELLGRVQRQEMDGLFYICVSHVKVVGRPPLACI